MTLVLEEEPQVLFALRIQSLHGANCLLVFTSVVHTLLIKKMFLYHRGAKSGTLPPIERLDTSDTLSSLSKDRTKSPVRSLL